MIIIVFILFIILNPITLKSLPLVTLIIIVPLHDLVFRNQIIARRLRSKGDIISGQQSQIIPFLVEHPKSPPLR